MINFKTIRDETRKLATMKYKKCDADKSWHIIKEFAAEFAGGLLGGVTGSALATLAAGLAGGFYGAAGAKEFYALMGDRDDNGKRDVVDRLRNLVFGATSTITTPLPPDLDGGNYTFLRQPGKDELVANAKADIAWRYALREFNSFVITDVSYAVDNQDGSLDLYDETTNPGGMTDEYLADRAAMLGFENGASPGAMETAKFIATPSMNPVTKCQLEQKTGLAGGFRGTFKPKVCPDRSGCSADHHQVRHSRGLRPNRRIAAATRRLMRPAVHKYTACGPARSTRSTSSMFQILNATSIQHLNY